MVVAVVAVTVVVEALNIKKEMNERPEKDAPIEKRALLWLNFE